MKTVLVWAALLLGLVVQQGHTTSAWHRALFGRDPRIPLRRNGGGAVKSDVAASTFGTFDTVADKLTKGYNDPLAPYAMQKQLPLPEQTEVYGIVEPLIEDTPCANRACLVNADCCPTGVCVNTYGEGKCIYVYGRKRDLCQRNADCAHGSICTLNVADGGIWTCRATELMQDLFELKQSRGDECSSSAECQVAQGMCCLVQKRPYYYSMPKYSCGYFRDPFDCIDMVKADAEKVLKRLQN